MERAILARVLVRNHTLQLSWMGSWGSQSAKPTRVWGTAPEAQVKLHRVCPGDESCALRPWFSGLYRRLTRDQAAKLRSQGDDKPITIKRVREDGTVSVPLGRYPIVKGWHQVRCGGPGLKATQVYPKGYGARVCVLHRKMMDR